MPSQTLHVNVEEMDELLVTSIEQCLYLSEVAFERLMQSVLDALSLSAPPY